MNGEQQPKATTGARNFFLYFLLFALLYIVAINFGGALFSFIDKAFPVTGRFYTGYFSSYQLRFNLAALIIATPALLFMARKMYRDAQKFVEVKRSALRRWLTYLTLLITTLVVVGDLIALVYNLLGGETTTRFILKALVVLFIAAAILYYYLQDVKKIKEEAPQPSKLPQMYFNGTIILVVLVVIVGFFLIGSPGKQRLINNDEARIQDLQEIEGAINYYAQVQGSLPQSLSEVTLRDVTKVDPVTDTPYTYETVSQTNYNLCATFETSNITGEDEERYYPTGWLHKEGYICFERSIADILKERDRTIVPSPIVPLPVK